MPESTPRDQVEELVAEARRAFAQDVDQLLLEIRAYSASLIEAVPDAIRTEDAWLRIRGVLLEKFDQRVPLRSHADPVLLRLVRDASRLLNQDVEAYSWGGDRRDWNRAAEAFIDRRARPDRSEAHLMKTTNDDDQGARGRSLSGDSATGSPRSPQPNGSQHTPGPWIVYSGHTVVPAVDAHKKLGGSVDPDREAAHYAKVIHGMGNCDAGTDYPQFYRSRVVKAEAVANAHLIAAAPELLDALKVTLNYWKSTGFAECEPDCDCIVGSVRNAIAKAEGR